MYIGMDERKKRSIGAIVKEAASQYGQRVYAQCGGKDVTYHELDEQTNRVANSMLKLGITKGSKVALMLPNSLEFLYTWFGLAKLGAIDVPLNTNLKGDRLKYIINNSDSEAIVLGEQYVDRIMDVQSELNNIKHVILHSSKPSASKMVFNTIPFSQILGGAPSPPEVTVLSTEDSAIIYTSGTTGLSKGVLLSHESIVTTSEFTNENARFTDEDIFYVCMPLFHLAARTTGIIPALLLGARIAIVEKFSASRFWEDIWKYKATTYYYTGSVQVILYNQPEKPEDKENLVRVAVGAGFPGSIMMDFEKRFGLKIMEGYGLTESPWTTLTPWGEGKPGSVGKAITGFEVRIVDDDGFEVPLGVTGEIVSRPNDNPYRLFNGYYKMPEETVLALRQTWFHTGDRGWKDEDGYFYFFDRKKDVIRRRGENISSFELENIICSHPSVAECAAIGVPSALTEDDVKVVVRLEPGAKLAPEELHQFCQDKMDYYMVPRYIEFVEILPKTPTERVEKYKLKENWLTPETWDSEKHE